MAGTGTGRRRSRTRGAIASGGQSLAFLLASLASLDPAAAQNVRDTECAAERSRCLSRREWAEVPTVRDQLRERRERGVNRPRLDRPDHADPRYGAPGFTVTAPGQMIGR